MTNILSKIDDLTAGDFISVKIPPVEGTIVCKFIGVDNKQRVCLKGIDRPFEFYIHFTEIKSLEHTCII